jgi:hypothetical protein
MLPLRKRVAKNEDTMNLKHAKSLASDVCKWQKADTSCRTLWGEGSGSNRRESPTPALDQAPNTPSIIGLDADNPARIGHASWFGGEAEALSGA